MHPDGPESDSDLRRAQRRRERPPERSGADLVNTVVGCLHDAPTNEWPRARPPLLALLTGTNGRRIGANEANASASTESAVRKTGHRSGEPPQVRAVTHNSLSMPPTSPTQRCVIVCARPTRWTHSRWPRSYRSGVRSYEPLKDTQRHLKTLKAT